MGTLAGHLLPGTFFIIWGLWWSFVTSIRYVQSKMKSPYKKNELVNYKATANMPLIILPCSRLRRLPVESYMKAILSFLGLLGEAITGFKVYHTPKIEIPSSANSHDMNEHSHDSGAHGDHVHKRDTHGVQIPEAHITRWHFEYVNAQHITMYAAFIIAAIVEILRHNRVDIPRKIEFVFTMLAFGVEGFLFAFHLHSRELLDIHVHVLLVYAIFGCVVFAGLEIYDDRQVLFTYGKILSMILQGTWFWEVGFILYPPTDSPSFKWDKNNHDQIMTVTNTFCWHIFLIAIGLLIELAIIKLIYKRSKSISNQWNELIAIDYFNDPENDAYNNDKYNLLSNNYSDRNAFETTRFLALNSEDETNERIEFDTRLNLSDNVKSKDQYSSSSTTSGNFSVENHK